MKKLEELKQYSFVVRQLVAREIKRKYSRSYLGILWSVLNPLLNFSFSVLPCFITTIERSKEISFTGCLTFTLHWYTALSVCAVITAFPFFFVFTVPFLFTVATPGFELLHLISPRSFGRRSLYFSPACATIFFFVIISTFSAALTESAAEHITIVKNSRIRHIHIFLLFLIQCTFPFLLYLIFIIHKSPIFTNTFYRFVKFISSFLILYEYAFAAPDAYCTLITCLLYPLASSFCVIERLVCCSVTRSLLYHKRRHHPILKGYAVFTSAVSNLFFTETL